MGYRPLTGGSWRLRNHGAGDSASSTGQQENLSGYEESQMPGRDEDSNENLGPEDSTPWYLQIKPPERESHFLLQRQSFPELPSNPPPLLQAMLEHVFTDLGMDDLVLFDLRRLDPPPALGANLIMVLCTARSEKHLHVSADRFCKWMKTAHKITPHADGLLGRGELKLKLKRKARRARILSRVGSLEASNTDDGIRTGWICVSVENIEDGRNAEEGPRPSDDFVGFGIEEHGAKVVIQMLTQEKREELDLEDLWGKTIRRHERKQDRISQGLEHSIPQHEVGQNHQHDETQTADFLPNLPFSSSMPQPLTHNNKHHPYTVALQGVRSFSTIRPSHYHQADPSDPHHIAPSYPSDIGNGIGATVADKFLIALPNQYEEHARQNGKASAELFRLKAHLDFACSLSQQHARSLLGNGAQDATTTPFLRSFHDALSLFPTVEQWGVRLSLINLGLDVGAPGYSKHDLTHNFHEMQSSVIHIPAYLYREIIITLLKPNFHEGNGQYPRLEIAFVYAATSILEDMIFRGHSFTPSSDQDREIYELLELAIIQSQPDTQTPNFHPNAFQRLRRLLNKMSSEPPLIAFEIRKLQVCATLHKFERMWEIWHHFAAEMRPRPAELYIAMLRGFAKSGHQARNADVLRMLVPEMKREMPPVQMDREVAEAVKSCLLVVDPSIEEDMATYNEADETEGSGQLGEWQRLWWTCESVIQEEGRWARELDDD